MTRRLPHSFSLIAVVALAACAGTRLPGGEPTKPDWAPSDATKCRVKASQTKPLVVEWRGEERAMLETQARKGLIAVRYSGCEMEVLQRCTARSTQYEYAANNPQKTTERIGDADELWAQVPMGAARLEGKLQEYKELNVNMTMVGRWEAAKGEVRKSELEGADCARATHVITGMTVGAFTFFAGAGSDDSAGAGVAGVGAGARSEKKRLNITQAGEPEKCEAASAKDKEPRDGCGAVIRVEVSELGASESVCPAGTEKQGNQCVAVVNRNCAGGMHFVDGQGCVANVVETPPPATTAPPVRTPPEPGVAAGGMVRIPAGTFNMGSNDGDAEEKPVHAVRVGAFEMDVTEVTVAQYAACVATGRCDAAPTTVDWSGITDDQRRIFSEACNGNRSDRQSHPVNCVNWNHADSYCRWAGKRLPTEEEWEYGARGTDGRKYPWGDSDPGPRLLNACGSECVAWGSARGQSWKSMYESDDGWATTAPVGTYPRGDSPFRLHDMAGNVWEWTSSRYSADYSKSRDNAALVLRGGGWSSVGPSLVRTAYRYRGAPSFRADVLGFRCAR